MKYQKHAFTLIEIMVGILIFSFIIVGGFYALSAVTVGKIKLIEQTNINKEAYFFSEKLFDEIKKGGGLDYEEYFNRNVVGTGMTQGHYATPTGFGNFGSGGAVLSAVYGDGYYYCLSSNTALMGTGGCVANTFNTYGASLGNKPQRYGQYNFEHIDYNANMSGGGDEDGDGNIRGDDDDETLGEGPDAFSAGEDTKELYLISGDKKIRTLFRWTVKNDPAYPAGNCNLATATGTGCLGTIEFLKLEGRDWGINHSSSTPSAGSNDGVVDTWVVHKDFTPTLGVVAGSNATSYRQKLFSDDIHVKSFKVYPYPNKDRKYAWKDTSPSNNIAPYVRIEMVLTPSWKKRAGMKGLPPDIKISTTINLADYFSQ